MIIDHMTLEMIQAFDWDYKFCLHCVYLKDLDFESWQWQDHS